MHILVSMEKWRLKDEPAFLTGRCGLILKISTSTSFYIQSWSSHLPSRGCPPPALDWNFKVHPDRGRSAQAADQRYAVAGMAVFSFRFCGHQLFARCRRIDHSRLIRCVSMVGPRRNCRWSARGPNIPDNRFDPVRIADLGSLFRRLSVPEFYRIISDQRYRTAGCQPCDFGRKPSLGAAAKAVAHPSRFAEFDLMPKILCTLDEDPTCTILNTNTPIQNLFRP